MRLRSDSNRLDQAQIHSACSCSLSLLGIFSNLTEINLIGLGLTESDNSLTEGGDLGWSRSAPHHAILGIVPSLSPPHVWALLVEFWWMLQLAGWGVRQINSSIDGCTQWDLDLLGGWGRPGFLCFYLHTKKQTHSVGPFSNILRTGCSLTRNSYGVPQNQVSTGERDITVPLALTKNNYAI